MKALLSSVVFVGVLGFAGAASAQTSSSEAIAAAQALYDAAVDLMEKKQFDAACPKLEEASRLVPEGVGVRIQLGECFEGQGKLASAFAAYNLAEQLAARAGQKERETLSHDRAKKLAPRLAKMKVHVPTDVARLEGLRIARNGIDVGKPQWDTPLPVDRGPHELKVEAEGKLPFLRSVMVKRDGEVVSVTVGPLVDDPNAGERTAAVDWKLPTGLVLGGLGVVGIGVASGLGGVALGKANEVDSRGLCNAELQCTQEGVNLRSEGRTLGNVATGLFVGGGVLLGTGVIFLVVSATDDGTESGGPSKGTSAALRVGPTGIEIGGRF